MDNRVLFLSHGGGPLPLLGDPSHQEMVDKLKLIASEIPRPSAIIVISAHWETPKPTITAADAPALIYDYYGFPPEAYDIKYPCPGNSVLAEQLVQCLGTEGFDARLDKQRGFDHGLYVPLKIMYPEADIPCIQLSLLDSLDPELHLRMGNALSELQQHGLLILGSGFSFHNMKAFFTPDTEETRVMNEQFESWLIETCSSSDIDEAERERRLIDWQEAPNARYCHPREEHLLPLHVCYGAARSACQRYYELPILNKKSSLYLW